MEPGLSSLLMFILSFFQLNHDDRVSADVSPDHLRLFPLHDDVLTRPVPIDDQYPLKMMFHLIWLREQATM
jgi:hypothetical protein